MNEPDPFSNGDPAGDDAPYEWLDEWLCEYVDGTMDPALEKVFRTYVEANPELKAHVARLRETRDLLSECSGPKPLSDEACQRACDRVQRRVCGRVECDMLRSQVSLESVVEKRSAVVAGLTLSTVALVLGLFTGALLFGPSPSATAVADAPADPERNAAPQRDAPRVTATPAPQPLMQYRLSQDSTLAAPSGPLPLTTIGAP